MDGVYNTPMNIEEKERIARRGNMGLEACAIRLAAARRVANVSQAEVAEAAGIKKTAYSNMETGRSFPTRPVMKFFHRLHRIDFNFLMHGDFAQLPGDVQSVIFDALIAAGDAWDQRSRSDLRQVSSRPKRMRKGSSPS